MVDFEAIAFVEHSRQWRYDGFHVAYGVLMLYSFSMVFELTHDTNEWEVLENECRQDSSQRFSILWCAAVGTLEVGRL